MRKTSLYIILIGVFLITGCGFLNKEIPVTVDTQKEITKEIQQIKENLDSIPVSNIKDSVRASISVETNIGVDNEETILMGTDIIKHKEENILVSYMVSNRERSEWKEKFQEIVSNEKGRYYTNEEGSGLYWKFEDWHILFLLTPSTVIPTETRVEWANTFLQDKNLASDVSQWVSLEDVKFVKDIPGENVTFKIGVSARNPNQDILKKIPNSLYAVIKTDIKKTEGYQFNHSVIPKEDFDMDIVEELEEIEFPNNNAWYNSKEREFYWEDEKFVYHLQDNPLGIEGHFFTLEDYKKFANLN